MFCYQVPEQNISYPENLREHNLTGWYSKHLHCYLRHLHAANAGGTLHNGGIVHSVRCLWMGGVLCGGVPTRVVKLGPVACTKSSK
jgi:hypothetical protein